MPLTMYDLAGADAARRFSPFCWRTKLAVAHKGLALETVPWRFTEKALLPAGGKTVPALIDGDTVLGDSWAIANHLETAYPDRPSLFGGDAARNVTHVLNAWCDSQVHATIARLVVADIHDHIADQDKEYFKSSREARFGGRALADVQASRDSDVKAFRSVLNPVRAALAERPSLGGAQPMYADYVIMGCFLWIRAISRFEPLAADDTVLRDWRERVLAAHPFVLKSPMY